MPRKPRVHYYGAVYHVMARGNNKEAIFASEKDRNKYLELVRRYKAKYDFLLYAYVLMENHVHLLVEVRENPLSKIMQGIQLSYTQYFNKKYDRVGHVFQQRYKAILCTKDEYLITLIKYIHLNPVRAEIGTLDYAWSSHKDYIRGTDQLVDLKFPLSLFDSNRNAALKYYAAFMSAGQDMTGPEINPDTVQDTSQIGKKQQCCEPAGKIPPHELVKLVAQEMSVPREMIMKRNKKPDIVKARRMFIYLAVTNGILTRTEAAEYMGIGQSTVTKAVNEVEADEELLSKVKRLQNTAKENLTK